MLANEDYWIRKLIAEEILELILGISQSAQFLVFDL